MASEVAAVWVVTTGRSLYRVTNERDENQTPIVILIESQAGNQSQRSIRTGGRLLHGQFVGIVDNPEHGIVMFHPQHPRPDKRETAYDVHSSFKGGHSSPIVGIFLDEADARTALNYASSEAWDPLFEQDTRNALAAIGREHATIVPDESVWKRFGF